MTPAPNADAPPNAPASKAWAPGPKLGRALHVLFQLLGAVTGIASIAVCTHTAELAFPEFGLLIGPFVWLVLLALSVFIHECGHYTAARLLGMHVVAGHVGPLDLQARRHGIRWRWKVKPRPSSGAILSIPNSRRDFQPQLFWHAAGGPAASLALGALAGVLVALLPDGPSQGFALGLLVLNVGMGASNLVPTTHKMATDGLRLVHAWRVQETDPSLAHLRLGALSMAGVTADRLPLEQLDLLAAQEEPMPLIHFWFKLKGLQNQSRWEEAAALAGELQRLRGALTDPVRAQLADLLILLECELRFSALMAGADDALPPVDVLTDESDWLNPILRPRCLAAMAAVKGNPDEARRWLQEAESLAENSSDPAQRTSESRIRAAIASRLRSPEQLLA